MAHALRVCVLVGVVLVGSTVCSAAFIATTGSPISLASLENEPLRVLDKEFSNFDLFAFAVGGAPTPTLEGIFVRGGYESTTGDVALEFITAWIAGTNELVNAHLSFDVAVVEGRDLIKDVAMKLVSVSTTGKAKVAVSETVTGPQGQDLAVLSLSKQADDGNAFLFDHQEFPPVAMIHVEKDITLVGGNAGGIAHVSKFYQYYSQVPEPAGLTLLALGAAALMRRKKR